MFDGTEYVNKIFDVIREIKDPALRFSILGFAVSFHTYDCLIHGVKADDVFVSFASGYTAGFRAESMEHFQEIEGQKTQKLAGIS